MPTCVIVWASRCDLFLKSRDGNRRFPKTQIVERKLDADGKARQMQGMGMPWPGQTFCSWRTAAA